MAAASRGTIAGEAFKWQVVVGVSAARLEWLLLLLRAIQEFL